MYSGCQTPLPTQLSGSTPTVPTAPGQVLLSRSEPPDERVAGRHRQPAEGAAGGDCAGGGAPDGAAHGRDPTPVTTRAGRLHTRAQQPPVLSGAPQGSVHSPPVVGPHAEPGGRGNDSRTRWQPAGGLLRALLG